MKSRKSSRNLPTNGPIPNEITPICIPSDLRSPSRKAGSILAALQKSSKATNQGPPGVRTSRATGVDFSHGKPRKIVTWKHGGFFHIDVFFYILDTHGGKESKWQCDQANLGIFDQELEIVIPTGWMMSAGWFRTWKLESPLCSYPICTEENHANNVKPLEDSSCIGLVHIIVPYIIYPIFSKTTG